MIKVEIRRQDGTVEDSVVIGDTQPAEDIAAALAPLADLYAGTGYVAMVTGLAPEAVEVGRF